jgi:post-segregation antitoxin (ccd killing protein)
MKLVSIEKHRRRAAQGEDGLRISWAEENAAAIAERHAWIEVHGAPLADLQVLKVD